MRSPPEMAKKQCSSSDARCSTPRTRTFTFSASSGSSSALRSSDRSVPIPGANGHAGACTSAAAATGWRSCSAASTCNTSIESIPYARNRSGRSRASDGCAVMKPTIRSTRRRGSGSNAAASSDDDSAATAGARDESTRRAISARSALRSTPRGKSASGHTVQLRIRSCEARRTFVCCTVLAASAPPSSSSTAWISSSPWRETASTTASRTPVAASRRDSMAAG